MQKKNYLTIQPIPKYSQMDQKQNEAFYVKHLDIDYSYKINQHSSIFKAEMFAILKSLYWIEDSPYTKVIIISDSLSSLISIETHSSRSNSALLLEVLISLRRLCFKNVYVMFLWVPSPLYILSLSALISSIKSRSTNLQKQS